LLSGLPSMPEPERLVLRTARLDLLPINREHADNMFKVLRDSSLYEFTSGSPPVDVDALARLYECSEHRVTGHHAAAASPPLLIDSPAG
jgi:hypothetical protein